MLQARAASLPNEDARRWRSFETASPEIPIFTFHFFFLILTTLIIPFAPPEDEIERCRHSVFNFANALSCSSGGSVPNNAVAWDLSASIFNCFVGGNLTFNMTESLLPSSPSFFAPKQFVMEQSSAITALNGYLLFCGPNLTTFQADDVLNNPANGAGPVDVLVQHNTFENVCISLVGIFPPNSNFTFFSNKMKHSLGFSSYSNHQFYHLGSGSTSGGASFWDFFFARFLNNSQVYILDNHCTQTRFSPSPTALDRGHQSLVEWISAEFYTGTSQLIARNTWVTRVLQNTNVDCNQYMFLSLVGGMQLLPCSSLLIEDNNVDVFNNQSAAFAGSSTILRCDNCVVQNSIFAIRRLNVIDFTNYGKTFASLITFMGGLSVLDQGIFELSGTKNGRILGNQYAGIVYPQPNTTHRVTIGRNSSIIIANNHVDSATVSPNLETAINGTYIVQLYIAINGSGARIRIEGNTFRVAKTSQNDMKGIFITVAAVTPNTATYDFGVSMTQNNISFFPLRAVGPAPPLLSYSVTPSVKLRSRLSLDKTTFYDEDISAAKSQMLFVLNQGSPRVAFASLCDSLYYGAKRLTSIDHYGSDPTTATFVLLKDCSDVANLGAPRYPACVKTPTMSNSIYRTPTHSSPEASVTFTRSITFTVSESLLDTLTKSLTASGLASETRRLPSTTSHKTIKTGSVFHAPTQSLIGTKSPTAAQSVSVSNLRTIGTSISTTTFFSTVTPVSPTATLVSPTPPPAKHVLGACDVFSLHTEALRGSVAALSATGGGEENQLPFLLLKAGGAAGPGDGCGRVPYHVWHDATRTQMTLISVGQPENASATTVTTSVDPIPLSTTPMAMERQEMLRNASEVTAALLRSPPPLLAPLLSATAAEMSSNPLLASPLTASYSLSSESVTNRSLTIRLGISEGAAARVLSASGGRYALFMPAAVIGSGVNNTGEDPPCPLIAVTGAVQSAAWRIVEHVVLSIRSIESANSAYEKESRGDTTANSASVAESVPAAAIVARPFIEVTAVTAPRPSTSAFGDLFSPRAIRIYVNLSALLSPLRPPPPSKPSASSSQVSSSLFQCGTSTPLPTDAPTGVHVQRVMHFTRLGSSGIERAVIHHRPGAEEEGKEKGDRHLKRGFFGAAAVAEQRFAYAEWPIATVTLTLEPPASQISSSISSPPKQAAVVSVVGSFVLPTVASHQAVLQAIGRIIRCENDPCEMNVLAHPLGFRIGIIGGDGQWRVRQRAEAKALRFKREQENGNATDSNSTYMFEEGGGDDDEVYDVEEDCLAAYRGAIISNTFVIVPASAALWAIVASIIYVTREAFYFLKVWVSPSVLSGEDEKSYVTDHHYFVCFRRALNVFAEGMPKILREYLCFPGIVMVLPMIVAEGQGVATMVLLRSYFSEGGVVFLGEEGPDASSEGRTDTQLVVDLCLGLVGLLSIVVVIAGWALAIWPLVWPRRQAMVLRRVGHFCGAGETGGGGGSGAKSPTAANSNVQLADGSSPQSDPAPAAPSGAVGALFLIFRCLVEPSHEWTESEAALQRIADRAARRRLPRRLLAPLSSTSYAGFEGLHAVAVASEGRSVAYADEAGEEMTSSVVLRSNSSKSSAAALTHRFPRDCGNGGSAAHAEEDDSLLVSLASASSLQQKRKNQGAHDASASGDDEPLFGQSLPRRGIPSGAGGLSTALLDTTCSSSNPAAEADDAADGGRVHARETASERRQRREPKHSVSGNKKTKNRGENGASTARAGSTYFFGIDPQNDSRNFGGEGGVAQECSGAVGGERSDLRTWGHFGFGGGGYAGTPAAAHQSSDATLLSNAEAEIDDGLLAPAKNKSTTATTTKHTPNGSPPLDDDGDLLRLVDAEEEGRGMCGNHHEGGSLPTAAATDGHQGDEQYRRSRLSSASSSAFAATLEEADAAFHPLSARLHSLSHMVGEVRWIPYELFSFVIAISIGLIEGSDASSAAACRTQAAFMALLVGAQTVVIFGFVMALIPIEMVFMALVACFSALMAAVGVVAVFYYSDSDPTRAVELVSFVQAANDAAAWTMLIGIALSIILATSAAAIDRCERWIAERRVARIRAHAQQNERESAGNAQLYVRRTAPPAPSLHSEESDRFFDL